MISKLSLGTVQFGLDYGIHNSRGKVSIEEVREILELASESGIDTLDTAFAYGDSEKVLGKAINRSASFKIVTKYPADDFGKMPMAIWQESYENLGCREIYGYLLHNYHSFRNRLSLIDFMQELRAKGKVERTGFSLYEPSELEEIIDSAIPFELVQIPFSVLDQRFLPYFPKLRDLGVEIHTRSSFLQGLVFMRPDNLNDFFKPVKNHLQTIVSKAEEVGISVAELCLGFCLAHQKIDRVVVGVDGIEHLKQNIRCVDIIEKIAPHLSSMSDLSFHESKILNPSMWEIA